MDRSPIYDRPAPIEPVVGQPSVHCVTCGEGIAFPRDENCGRVDRVVAQRFALRHSLHRVVVTDYPHDGPTTPQP